MRLGDFLAAPRPAWDWTTHDCCRWVDRWVQACGHGSPMAALGIRYDSETSALRRIAEAGGLAPLWDRGLALLSIEPVEDPIAGDVGVIQRATTCGLNEAAAIFTGMRWVSLGLRGLDFGPAETLAAWRV